jgi:hypothetical protein
MILTLTHACSHFTARSISRSAPFGVTVGLLICLAFGLAGCGTSRKALKPADTQADSLTATRDALQALQTKGTAGLINADLEIVTAEPKLDLSEYIADTAWLASLGYPLWARTANGQLTHTQQGQSPQTALRVLELYVLREQTPPDDPLQAALTIAKMRHPTLNDIWNETLTVGTRDSLPWVGFVLSTNREDPATEAVYQAVWFETHGPHSRAFVFEGRCQMPFTQCWPGFAELAAELPLRAFQRKLTASR